MKICQTILYLKIIIFYILLNIYTLVNDYHYHQADL